MSALHEATFPGLPAGIKDLFAASLWKWIHENQDREIYKAKVWVITKTFRVSDLHPVFEMLLGPDPTTNVVGSAATMSKPGF